MQVLIEGKSPQVWGTSSRKEPEEDLHTRKSNQKGQAKNIKTSFTYFKIFPRAAVYGWLTFPYPASEFFPPRPLTCSPERRLSYSSWPHIWWCHRLQFKPNFILFWCKGFKLWVWDLLDSITKKRAPHCIQ